MFFPIRRAASAILALSLTTAPLALQAEENLGAYLAGRQALFDSNYDEAAKYYTRALTADPQNPALLENLTLSQLAQGNIERALPVAQQMERLGLRSQIAHMVIAAGLIQAEDYETLLARNPEEQGVSPLVDGLTRGWALLGQGSVSEALAHFDALAEEQGLRSFALLHKAFALGAVGDYEGAEEMFAADGAQLSHISRRAAIARAQILSQLGRNEDALEMMADLFGANFDPGLTAIADRLAGGESVSFDIAPTVLDGMAEVFFTIGAVLNGEAEDDYALVYAQVAKTLRPEHVDAILLSAELLDQLGQYDLADQTYKAVPKEHPDYHAAELGRAEALRRAAKPDAAIEVLEQLARGYPTLPAVHMALGDLQRQEENYAKAVLAYDRALEFTEPDAGARWFILYARGICHERLKNWPLAEADFRAALELNPDQPQVLNYLGYSLVERREKLDEALDMIERAVAARPESGYIVDSLGWVLYRLGRYDEAVGHMERAVELMPVDPVVNDHLGDVYWAVGRYREAEFQWSRALSFIDPEDTDGEADPVRIRRKLEIGLDQVLAEEGAAPLKVADDEG
ncbi:MAG: tetratricopeptide repeat protein [Rhodobacteraceae bacterium]|nr:tetratricopeptide repeat protein [Paracoccaceae bacterium]